MNPSQDILAIRRQVDTGGGTSRDEFLVIHAGTQLRWTRDPNLAFRFGTMDAVLSAMSRARAAAAQEPTPVRDFTVVRLEPQFPLLSPVVSYPGNEAASARRAAFALVGPLAETLAFAASRGTVQHLAALVAGGGPVSVEAIEAALTSDLPAA